jgi:phenylacetate-CoA ligase
MLPAFISKLIIYGANLKSMGALFGLQKEIYSKNNTDKPFSEEEIKAYLRKWGRSEDITTLPLMNKSDLREYAAKLDPSVVYKVFYTGGSTGEPLKTPYSKLRSLIRTSAVLYYNKLAGYRNGDRYMLTRSKDDSSFIKSLKNEIIFVPNDLSQARVESVVKEIIDKKVKVLIGYPSVFYELALYLNKHPELKSGLKVKTYISTSEPVDQQRHEFIKEAFQCEVLDRYANEENGIMAHQRTFGGEYFVDRYNLYLEVIDPETLKPVKEGEVGKVVLTDTKSDIYPVIRYDTGDFAEAARYVNGRLLTIKRIVGRVVDQFYKTNGEPFSPLTLGPYIRLPLTSLGIHFQFQFAQTGSTTYELRLKVPEGSVPDSNRESVVKGLKKVLGEDALIEVAYVDTIKSRPSGKRPLYINEYLHAEV